PANYDNSPEVLAQFYDELLDGLEDIPGVARAGAVTSLPLQGIAGSLSTSIDEFPVADDEFPPTFLIRRATPGYFEAMGIDVLEGREFTDEDHQERLGSLIISESIKDRFWPDVSALGKRMAIAGAAARSVGVVRDVNAVGLDTEAEPYIYKPLLDSVGGGVAAMAMAVRANADPLSLVPAIRSLIASMDAELPISEIRLMEGIVSDSLSRTSFTMTLLLLAAAIALFLGSVGIYGVISYIVAQRTDEIGVRLALGAGAPEVRWMILMQGMRLAAVGVVVGLLAAVAMGRLMTSLLYGISPFDVTTFVIGAVIFLVVATLAGIIPAVRASRIPPAVALQSG
ncbi:MAG TPA: hypothetical protein DCX61_09580, partial [Gemmatimonadetes bacterium]|nr:hypothetical protein [Gemmatimonadota bacterium]